MKGNVENLPTTRVAKVNAISNIRRKFPDNEQQKFSVYTQSNQISKELKRFLLRRVKSWIVKEKSSNLLYNFLIIN